MPLPDGAPFFEDATRCSMPPMRRSLDAGADMPDIIDEAMPEPVAMPAHVSRPTVPRFLPAIFCLSGDIRFCSFVMRAQTRRRWRHAYVQRHHHHHAEDKNRCFDSAGRHGLSEPRSQRAVPPRRTAAPRPQASVRKTATPRQRRRRPQQNFSNAPRR